MQPDPPPKVYPQDAACALLRSLFIMVKSLCDHNTQHDRTGILVQKLEKELRDIPEEEHFVADRQQCGQNLQVAQALSRTHEKSIGDASMSIGMCLLSDIWSPLHRRVLRRVWCTTTRESTISTRKCIDSFHS